MLSTLSRLARDKDHRARAMGVSSAVEQIFNETAVHEKAQASNRMAKANRASRGPRESPHSQAKARGKKTRGYPKENPKEPKVRTKVPKAHTRWSLRSLTRNREQARTFRNLHRHVPLTLFGTMAGVSMTGMMTGVLLDGTRVGSNTSASSFSLGGLDVSATSSPKRFRMGEHEPGHKSCSEHIPLFIGPEGARDGRVYRTAGGEWLLEGGAWQFQGYDENGLLRSLNGRLTGVHKVLCSDAEIACKGRQDFHLGHDGGYMIPIHIKNGSENEKSI